MPDETQEGSAAPTEGGNNQIGAQPVEVDLNSPIGKGGGEDTARAEPQQNPKIENR